MKLQHTRDLKQIADAGKSEVANTRKELDELHSEIKEVQGWLQEELQAEKDLRELEKKRNDALEEVKETQAKIIKDLDEQVGKTFPESQDRAIEAIIEARRDDPLPNPDGWTTEDHLTALSAWVSYMDKLGKYLPGAAIRAFANLWPGEKIPDRVEILPSRLMESGTRLTEWRRSSERSRADTALKFVCSWIMSFRNLTAVCPSHFRIGLTSTHLVNLSTMTKM
ncbi:hypothetical protein QYE76_019196 [Lolium multiflorum]|uniref:Uncharacterized protein n=1 Tax=Lolium multiflorum TaxID=4521 RepID=A0AAD8R614_LOLMU|nr:hypothetical protein QYE76_019196 [Lolium multiflorum]